MRVLPGNLHNFDNKSFTTLLITRSLFCFTTAGFYVTNSIISSKDSTCIYYAWDNIILQTKKATRSSLVTLVVCV